MGDVKQAMILAAGRGQRFRPVTDTIPKPMVEVGGVALIDWQLELLLASGVSKIVVNVCYLKDMLIAHLARWKDKAEIIISHEDTALETGGGIKHALHHFGDELFYSLNSDVILFPKHDNTLVQLHAAFQKNAATRLSVLLNFKQHSIGLDSAGDFFCDTFGALQRRGAAKASPFFFTGAQLMHPSVFEGIEDTIFSMNKIYDRLLVEQRQMIGIINAHGSMLHVGDPEGHKAAEHFLKTIKISA
jgi:N-acetyl-alpha-D-muramate 1-phosphate uridylyltransferase